MTIRDQWLFTCRKQPLIPYSHRKVISQRCVRDPSTHATRAQRNRMSKDTLNVSGVKYTTAEAGYFEKRTLKRTAGIWGLWGLAVAAVSYTHLRAHETDSYLVCRL